MITLTDNELMMISGGDAAATRQPGQNSWGESPADSSAGEPFNSINNCISNFRPYIGPFAVPLCHIRIIH